MQVSGGAYLRTQTPLVGGVYSGQASTTSWGFFKWRFQAIQQLISQHFGNIQRQTPICQLCNTLSFFYANLVAFPTLIIYDTALTVITIHTNSTHSDMFYV